MMSLRQTKKVIAQQIASLDFHSAALRENQ